MAEHYVWTRRDNETSTAYNAFQIYLDMGGTRTHQKVCEKVGKSRQLITDWAGKYGWTERVRAFDRHVAEAKTDGMISQLTETRDKNLALMDKLRSHLSNRLDTFITANKDPSMLWTQALVAMARVEQNSLMLKEDAKSTQRVERVMELVERLEKEHAE